MKIQVQKWGNSLALRIPKSFAVETKIDQGTMVELQLIDGKMVIEPVAKADYALDHLLAGVTAENLHSEIDFGSPEGNEVW
ncbi:MAG: AbrB/MazE/SpoVT family DNA-binding domain-containing protein [Acidobacteria bacterium]|nr:AbrB/MazE/SpoVT family DNA-binding domain-containing protein [Acidobacteriota bacterium]